MILEPGRMGMPTLSINPEFRRRATTRLMVERLTFSSLAMPFQWIQQAQTRVYNTPNWMMARKTPVLSVQAVLKFAELKSGKFTDISRYGVFDKEIER